MLRSEIETKMKAAKQQHIVLWYNKEDTLGVYCELKGGYLYDYTGHRVDRKKDIWGYINYYGEGDADIHDWNETIVIPLLRNRYRVEK